MNKDERKLYRVLVNWMKRHLEEARDEDLSELINLYGIGEVNTTRLAEEAAHDSGLIDDPDKALDNETHVIWDASIDAGEWYEAHY
jgi:hypothetical protein